MRWFRLTGSGALFLQHRPPTLLRDGVRLCQHFIGHSASIFPDDFRQFLTVTSASVIMVMQYPALILRPFRCLEYSAAVPGTLMTPALVRPAAMAACFTCQSHPGCRRQAGADDFPPRGPRPETLLLASHRILHAEEKRAVRGSGVMAGVECRASSPGFVVNLLAVVAVSPCELFRRAHPIR
jgi:hypothetical protein